jgi:hypothetical protein
MPGSRFAAIPDAGHFPQLDQPRRFVEALIEFMADTKPSRLDAGDLRKRLLGGAPG